MAVWSGDGDALTGPAVKDEGSGNDENQGDPLRERQPGNQGLLVDSDKNSMMNRNTDETIRYRPMMSPGLVRLTKTPEQQAKDEQVGTELHRAESGAAGRLTACRTSVRVGIRERDRPRFVGRLFPSSTRRKSTQGARSRARARCLARMHPREQARHVEVRV